LKTPVKLTGVVKKASKERTLPDLLRKRSAAMIFCDELVIRAPHYKDIVDMAKYSSAPVINAMADDENHPGQVLCDVFTMYEKVGKIKEINLAFIGKGVYLSAAETERRENKYVEEVGSLLQKFHAW